jgi:mannose-6-phosphate isomerase
VPAKRLECRQVERVWGRRPASGGPPIGELWYEAAAAGVPAPLLVKQLDTSARLSIQVHPGDAAARRAGLPCGKDEAWLVLAADPGAVIGLGLKRAISPEALRAAALDGSIEELVEWRVVRAGDFFYSPAGTIHAIGGGISLVEVQQNVDVTYRLYDYGRDRPLQLDQAVAAASPEPWTQSFAPALFGPGRTVLHAGGAFVCERWRFRHAARIEGPLLLVPLAPGARLDGVPLSPGSVWQAEGECRLDGADLIAAYSGASVRAAACIPAVVPPAVTAAYAGSTIPERRVSPA